MEERADHQMTAKPLLQLSNVSKYFGGVKAVDGVSLTIETGEIHGIVGENGAGKSTLMNILAGAIHCDAGEILFDGHPYRPSSAGIARKQGISIVFQETALFPALPVYANVFIDRELGHYGLMDRKAMRSKTEETLQRMGVDLSVDDTPAAISVGKRQWVEIARALNDGARVLILDEPNSCLDQRETEALFGLISNLRREGITILYVSHRIEEVLRIADRVTVLRDGHKAGTWESAKVSPGDIVAAMVGRKVSTLFDRKSAIREEVVLEVRDLACGGMLEGLSFTVRAGEVVGLAALAGCGITELFETIFGLRREAAGTVLLSGFPLKGLDPSETIRKRVGFVPSDRRGYGLMSNWNVLENMTIAVLPRLSTLGLINHKATRQVSDNYVHDLRIATEGLEKQILLLSGGNQQKVLLARWLATDPLLLLLDDPTRGIDVGAKQDIYALVDEVASRGVAVLLTSSELDEVIALSDRVLVLREGQLMADVPHQVADKDLVMTLVAGDLLDGKRRLEAVSASR